MKKITPFADFLGRKFSIAEDPFVPFVVLCANAHKEYVQGNYSEIVLYILHTFCQNGYNSNRIVVRRKDGPISQTVDVWRYSYQQASTIIDKKLIYPFDNIENALLIQTEYLLLLHNIRFFLKNTRELLIKN